VRITVEPRHRSWFEGETGAAVRRVLVESGAALCWADRRRPVTPDWLTAGWGYVRFHGGRARPASCYGETALATWAKRLRAAGLRPGADLFAYFNNDHAGCALRDAGIFGRLATQVGLRPTATPDPDSISVG
jgi:uncharacterized protein YecE (DUF72 family)